jgi:hypothetical protein
MPIRPENKYRYPPNWYEISQEIRRRADHKCEWCGVPNGELGGRSPGGKWHKARPLGNYGLGSSGLVWPNEGDWAWCEGWDKMLRIVRIVLTVAHLDHTPENCDPENLKCLCQRCHNRYDAPHRAAGIRERRDAATGQLKLFS